jgi:hypothetical protein
VSFANYAFCDCRSLHSICIPATLRQITGLAMAGSGIRNITVDVDNRFLRVCGDFLTDFDGRCLIRYFGNEHEVTIGRDIASISPGCFHGCDSILSVRFATDSRISSFSAEAFSYCPSLEVMSLSPSIQTLSPGCFVGSWKLNSIVFEAGCQLSNQAVLRLSEKYQLTFK